MKTIIEELRGKKTYVIAIIAGLVTVMKMLGNIDDATYTTLMGLLGAGGLATLRAAK